MVTHSQGHTLFCFKVSSKGSFQHQPGETVPSSAGFLLVSLSQYSPFCISSYLLTALGLKQVLFIPNISPFQNSIAGYGPHALPVTQPWLF